MIVLIRLTLVLALLFGISACSTVKGWFQIDDDDDPNQPAELIDIEEKVRIRKLWSTGVGDGQGDGLYRLQPVIQDEIIYAAGADGEVDAIDRETGRKLWKIKLDHPISGGIGLYEDSLFVGSSDGFAVKLDRDTGEQLWATRLRGEILAPPQSDGSIVIVQSYDGRVQGLDFDTGEIRWTHSTNVPVLTIRGTSTPILSNDTVFAGFANGKVLALRADTGDLIWEVRVAISQGRSEIDRIVDIDGTMTLVGGELYAASYHGRVVAIDVASGRKLWQQDVSSFSGVAQGFGNIYVADEDGTVTAYLRSGQGERWTQGALAYRGLSHPTAVSSYIAVADFEGIVHLLSQVDGEFVGRVKVDGNGVHGDMLSDGNVLYVLGDSGKLVAYEITARDDG